MGIARRLVLATCLLFGTVSPASAQAVGQILGVVTDTTGGVLPRVTVTVAGTGLQRPLVRFTNPDGTYTVPNVPIGIYAVTFDPCAVRGPTVWPECSNITT